MSQQNPPNQNQTPGEGIPSQLPGIRQLNKDSVREGWKEARIGNIYPIPNGSTRNYPAAVDGDELIVNFNTATITLPQGLGDIAIPRLEKAEDPIRSFTVLADTPLNVTIEAEQGVTGTFTVLQNTIVTADAIPIEKLKFNSEIAGTAVPFLMRGAASTGIGFPVFQNPKMHYQTRYGEFTVDDNLTNIPFIAGETNQLQEDYDTNTKLEAVNNFGVAPIFTPHIGQKQLIVTNNGGESVDVQLRGQIVGGEQIIALTDVHNNADLTASNTISISGGSTDTFESSMPINTFFLAGVATNPGDTPDISVQYKGQIPQAR